MDIGQLWVVESLQYLNLILVRLLFRRLPEELLCRGRRSILNRAIMRHWCGARCRRVIQLSYGRVCCLGFLRGRAFTAAPIRIIKTIPRPFRFTSNRFYYINPHKHTPTRPLVLLSYSGCQDTSCE